MEREDRTPVFTDRKNTEARADFPQSDCLSLNSYSSRDVPLTFSNEPRSPDSKQKMTSGEKCEEIRADSPVSTKLSLKSDHSREVPLTFSDGPGLSDTKSKMSSGGRPDEERAGSPVSTCPSLKSDHSKDVPFTFNDKHGLFDTKERKRTCDDIDSPLPCCVLCKEIVKHAEFSSCGHCFCKECIASYWEESNSAGDPPCPVCGKRCRKNPRLQTIVQSSIEQGNCSLQEVLDTHKLSLKQRCEIAIEGTAEVGIITHLNSIYTELYITEGQCEGVNVQHEVWQLETISKNENLHETPIKCHDIFKVLPGQKGLVRVVLTTGIAGIGKTFSVQKFTLDWAEGLENQDISLVILLSFRELNLVKEEQYSLLRLLHDFHPMLQSVTAQKLALCKVLFIFDGLDESRLSLDFHNNETVSDVNQRSSISLLLMNLIRGNLLPSALLWITSRPAAANQILPSYVDRMTEVRGFTDAQKEEYFRKRFSDDPMSSRVVSHIKASRSLYIMCYIPVFCWITATVLKHMLSADQKELPKTLTEMYAHFLLVQTKRKTQKYDQEHGATQQEQMQINKEVLLKLGRLAFENLEKGNIMFYQEDLESCGLDVREALVFSGLCTEIFKQECVLFQKMIYCFVHLSIQEFLAAVYMIDCYLNKEVEVLVTFVGEDWDKNSSEAGLDIFLSRVVKKSLNSGNGHLDLFVRFLHGLLLESNHHLLEGLVGWTASSTESIQRAINNLKKMNAYDTSPDRCINIFHCLMEMNDQSVHQDIQEYLQSDNRSEKKLTKTHCSALAYMLQMSEEVLDVLDLKKYNSTIDGRRRLLPAVRNCRHAKLSCCGLSEWHCEVLSSALMSNPSHLRELDLSENDYLLDSGVKLLCVGLRNPNCRLEILSLKSCSLSDSCCDSLAAALMSTSSCLRELDLSDNNYLKDAGVKLLSTGLESPHCRLETLRLSCCRLSEIGCAHVASAIKSNPSHLKEIDLSKNKVKDRGVILLSAALQTPECKLKLLRIDKCGLTEDCCTSLSSALESNPSSVKELELSNNDLQDSGVKLLCVGLRSASCGLEALRLRGCWLSENCCADLASALMCDSSSLRELDLCENDLQDSGVELLSTGLKSTHCRLETLKLIHCGITSEGCASLAAALKSNPSHLRELDLGKNSFQGSGVNLLSEILESPHCRLETLRMEEMK
ncbi:NACHT, LRR and PYD domains-containing protein 12-like [Cheilinus undulatus]|uniref:NACHT, LRR and PYD domains-containing protein 12-like n=1 Tax=Cheilinus undulatus TaxID=241271 RepID=UPI001BD663EE|nr:NACHT, LRR and PYD domains-containing protein 12-like [Cheilinus undulatus]